MPVASGARLGPYEILGPVGAGGMGEVYRARDPRLGREVAIKVLPAERLSDPARRARFEREARAVAALNHPNIVTIHGIESAGGVDFIVMELVAGQTLQTLIARRGMTVADALKVAVPLADALATAHAVGIVHRDVKPANVMVTPQGVVKVLDFGLAKLTQPDEANIGEATTEGATAHSRPGVAMGTAGYMSPEQAAGEPADVRSDVFSFGVVLYEMVTGKRAFAGASTAEVLAAVLRDEPRAPSEIVPGLPQELERIVQRCLRKEPARRFQSMRDVKIELEEVADSTSAAMTAAPARVKRRWAMALVALAVVAVTVASAALWRQRPTEPPAPRLVLLAHSRRTLSSTFSPDGTLFAFDSDREQFDRREIWLKLVGEAETRRLTTGVGDDCCPAWSPDGKRIAFQRSAPGDPAGIIHLVSPLGGPERRLSDLPIAGAQVSWSPDGRWLAAARLRAPGETTPESAGIHAIPTAGGQPTPLTFPRPPARDAAPAISPDGRALAFFTCEDVAVAACELNVLPIGAGLRPRGAPRRLMPQRFREAGLAWAPDGLSIVYGVYFDHLWRVRADGRSAPERVELAGAKAVMPFTLAGRDRLGFQRRLEDFDIYRYSLDSAAATPLVATPAVEFFPQYSPDGRRIAFSSDWEGDSAVWLADADGSSPVRLTRGGRGQGSQSWSPDGRSLSFDAIAEDGHPDVWTIGVDGAGLRQLTHRKTDHGPSSWSRDGRFVYFHSERTGSHEVWRIPATGGPEEQVTRHGGFLPRESPDGRTLYYKRADSDGPLLAMPTAGGDERTILACVPKYAYAVGAEGLFHLDCVKPGESPLRRTLRLWNATTGRDRAVATLETGFGWPLGLSVSPDGQNVLFLRYSASEDLMMIENFR